MLSTKNWDLISNNKRNTFVYLFLFTHIEEYLHSKIIEDHLKTPFTYKTNFQRDF